MITNTALLLTLLPLNLFILDLIILLIIVLIERCVITCACCEHTLVHCTRLALCASAIALGNISVQVQRAAQAKLVLQEYKWPATAAAAACPLGRTHWHCRTMLSSRGTIFFLLVCLLAPCQSDAARCANPFVCSEEDREESVAGSGHARLWEEGIVPYVFESNLRECNG